jgi:hypothetical protein
MTAQAPEIIILDGKAFGLYSTPLENYFKRIKWRPKFTFSSTANYRGYVARWEIFGKRLFLTGLFGNGWIIPNHLYGKLAPDPFEPASDDGVKSLRLVDLFPDQAPLVPAKWVTQRLVVPTGPRLVYKHFGFGSLHASYRLIHVVQGRVRWQRNLSGREWARRSGQFWPDEEWYAANDQASVPALIWPEPESQDDDEPLPDWRTVEDGLSRRLCYAATQIAALEQPCGLIPKD